MGEEVSSKANVTEAMYVQEGDAEVVYVGLVLARFLCVFSLASVVGVFFSVAVECVHEAVPCLV